MERTKELAWQIEEFMIYCKCKALRGKTSSFEQNIYEGIKIKTARLPYLVEVLFYKNMLIY